MFDSGHYHTIATSLVQGKGFANKNGQPQFYRLPGYPLFLAICYKLFGIDPEKALWAQLLLATLIPLLIFLLALALFPRAPGGAMLASLVTAIHPGYLTLSGQVLTETLFSIFFILFFIFFLPSFSLFFERKKILKASTAWLLGAGLSLGIASLIRPLGHYVFVLSLVLLLISSYPIRQKIKSLFTFSFGWIAIAGIWLLRNYLLTGFIFLHTLSGVHFLNHLATRVVMQSQNITYQQAQKKVNKKLATLEKQKQKLVGRALLAPEQNIIQEKLALKLVMSSPLISIKLGIINMLKTIFGLYSSDLLFIDSGGKLPEYSNKRTLKQMVMRLLDPDVKSKNILYVIYFEILLFLLILLGFGAFKTSALFCWDKFAFLLKISPFILLLVFISLACGTARLRLPFEPFLIIVSCMFWVNFLKKRLGNSKLKKKG